MSWQIVVEPEGKNPGRFQTESKNEGGMVIYLASNGNRQEVSRVAFVRRNSNNPKASFEGQLEKEIEKARASAKVLNEHTSAGVLV